MSLREVRGRALREGGPTVAEACAARAMANAPNLLRRVGASPTVAEVRALGLQFLSERGFSPRRTHLLLVLAFAWFVTISERLRRKNRNRNYRFRIRNPNSNCNYPPKQMLCPFEVCFRENPSKQPKQELSIHKKESKFKLQLPNQINAVSL